MNLVACSVKGGASAVSLQEVAGCSSVVVTCVVSVPRAFIISLKVGSDSSLDDRRSGSSWALFLILVVSLFLVGFKHAFTLGAMYLKE